MVEMLPTTEHNGTAARVQISVKFPNPMFPLMSFPLYDETGVLRRAWVSGPRSAAWCLLMIL